MNIVGGAAGAKYSQSFNLPQTDSQKAFDLLDSRFPARAGETAFVVFKATPSIEAKRADIDPLLVQLRGVKGIIEVRDLTVSPFNPRVALAEMQFESQGR